MKVEKTIVESFTAAIYVGFLERDTSLLHTMDEVRNLCRGYVDEVGLCVTAQPIEYIYTNGGEAGVKIGLINYPRFPSSPETIRHHALELASAFLYQFRQYKVSIVFSNETIMLSNEDLCDG